MATKDFMWGVERWALTEWMTGAGHVCCTGSLQEFEYKQLAWVLPHHTQPYFWSAVWQRLQSERPTEQLYRVTEGRMDKSGLVLVQKTLKNVCTQNGKWTTAWHNNILTAVISPYRSGELSTWKVSLLFTYTIALYSSTAAEYVYCTNNMVVIQKIMISW